MEYFSVGEMSKISFVSTQTLRYYDKIGLLKPNTCDSRSGYRYYTYREVMKLDEIQYMKLFGMTLEEIKWQFENRNVRNSFKMMKKQHHYIQNKIREMENIEKRIVHNMNNLKAGKENLLYLEPKIIFMEKRKAVSLEKEITSEEEYEIYIREISHKLYNNYFSDMGDYYASASIQDLKERRFRKYDSIGIIVLDDILGMEMKFIQGDEYACVYHLGDYCTIEKSYEVLCDYIEKKGYEIAGSGLEIYIVDNMDTNDKKEYITHLQIPIKRR